MFRLFDAFFELAQRIHKLPNRDGVVLRGLGKDDLKSVAHSHHYWMTKALSRYLVNRKAFATADLNSNHWSSKYIYNPAGFAYNTHVIRSFWQLVDTGYLHVDRKGFLDRESGRSGPTLYRLTKQGADWFEASLRAHDPNYGLNHYLVDPSNLPEIEPIRISEYEGGVKAFFYEHRKLKTYERTIKSESLRISTQRLNHFLKNCWIDLDLKDGQAWDTFQSKMQNRKRKDRPKYVDFTQKQLYRVFHDSNFSTGGRFYGGWWQTIPKEYRKYIMINGKATVELDYSELHPTILYAEKGLELNGDAYTGLFDYDSYQFTADRGSVEPFKAQKLKSMRNLYKKLFNALINSKKETVGPPKRTRISHTGMRWAEIKSRIYELHSPIKDKFCAEAGMRLMRKDSQLAELVMSHFAIHGVPVLPVHDSFIVHQGYKEELLDVMADFFRKEYKVDISITAKKLLPTKLDELADAEFGAPTTKNLDDLLADKDTPQWQRTNAFWAVTQT